VKNLLSPIKRIRELIRSNHEKTKTKVPKNAKLGEITLENVQARVLGMQPGRLSIKKITNLSRRGG